MNCFNQVCWPWQTQRARGARVWQLRDGGSLRAKSVDGRVTWERSSFYSGRSVAMTSAGVRAWLKGYELRKVGS